jgi:hypothetical protein
MLKSCKDLHLVIEDIGGIDLIQKLSVWRAIILENCKVKFTLEQAMKTQRGSRGIALLFP